MIPPDSDENARDLDIIRRVEAIARYLGCVGPHQRFYSPVYHVLAIHWAIQQRKNP